MAMKPLQKQNRESVSGTGRYVFQPDIRIPQFYENARKSEGSAHDR